MYVVAGVSGNTGKIVADTLLTAGEPVRVVVRDAAKGAAWQARGAEVAVAALEDTAALTAALRGARGAYLLVPPRMAAVDLLAENRAVTTSIAAAVRAAGLPHAVLLSSIAAHQPDGTGPIRSVHHAERALGEVTALTALRAAYFQENWGASLGQVAQGVLPTFVPADRAFAMVATADIGRTAAAALVEAQPGVIELAGPRDYTAAEVAAAVGDLVGAPVRALEAPLDAVVPTFMSFGISADVAGLYREMYAGLISGRVAWEGGAARAVRGTVGIEATLRALLGR